MAVIAIRAAKIDDAGRIAQIHVDSWRSTYAGLLPDHVLLGLESRVHERRWWRQALRRARRQHVVLVAEDSREGVIGFGSCGPSRDRALPFSGEIYTIYLRDDFHGLGLGRRLFVALSERLLETQGSSVIVWSLSTNPARFFYQALGGRFVARRRGSLGGTAIQEFAYGWDDVRELVALGDAQDRR